MRSVRELLNLDDDLLDDELQELELADLVAVWAGLHSLERAVEQELAARSTSLSAIGGLGGEED